MAGDWIPMRLDLDEDPAVIAISRRLGVDCLVIVGRLWKLWTVISRQTDNGWLPHYDAETIDAVLRLPGFSAALESVGWLQQRSGGIEVPNFERWLSESAKKRFKDTKRKRDERLCPNSVRKKMDENARSVLSSSVLDKPPPEVELKGGVGENRNGDTVLRAPPAQAELPHSNLLCYNSELVTPARLVVDHYQRCVTAHHARTAIDAEAVIGRFHAGNSKEQLIAYADNYRADCERRGIEKQYRIKAAKFYANGGAWMDHVSDTSQQEEIETKESARARVNAQIEKDRRDNAAKLSPIPSTNGKHL